MSKINCIDISYCQKNIDFTKVKKYGIDAAIIRAGYGREVSQKDAEFETHYKGAKSAGLKIGVYWFSYADGIADAQKEARTCISCIKGKSLDLPVFFDMELSSQTKYGKATLTKMVIAFCDEIKKAGYKAGVYSNLNWFSNYLDYNTLKSKYYIWLAQWSSKNSRDCDIWQNADNGRIDGINGNVDTDIIYNSSFNKATTNSDSTSSTKSVNYSVRVTSCNGLNVRKGANTSYGIITALPYNSIITISKESNGWGYCSTKGGWLCLTYTSKISTTTNVSSIKAGKKLTLKNVPLYVSSTASSKATTISGTYYLWDASKINGRYRITNSTSNVGESSAVTGWISQSYVK